MNSFRINLVQVLVVVDLVYIYLLLRYPPIHCSLFHPIQIFQALYTSYLLSSIHLHSVCSPLQTYRLYPSLLPSIHLWMNQESTFIPERMIRNLYLHITQFMIRLTPFQNQTSLLLLVPSMDGLVFSFLLSFLLHMFVHHTRLKSWLCVVSLHWCPYT